jgi:hypothetical protein
VKTVPDLKVMKPFFAADAAERKLVCLSIASHVIPSKISALILVLLALPASV